MRAMMSVGPPAGNPTTTRTGRFGYPSASDGAAPASSNRLARIQTKTRIVSLSLDNFLLAPSSARARFGTRAKRRRVHALRAPLARNDGTGEAFRKLPPAFRV